MSRPAVSAYSIIGLTALALFLGGITGNTSDTGDGIGMAVFGALFLSASVSGLLGALAGSRAHVWWALAGFFLPGYSLPFVLYYGLRGRQGGARSEACAARIAATEAVTNVTPDLPRFDVNRPLPRWEPAPGIERDPERIDVLVEQLRRFWRRHPDQRLGQLLCNLVGPKPNPLFYVEDHVVSEKLFDTGSSQVWPNVHAHPPRWLLEGAAPPAEARARLRAVAADIEREGAVLSNHIAALMDIALGTSYSEAP